MLKTVLPHISADVVSPQLDRQTLWKTSYLSSHSFFHNKYGEQKCSLISEISNCFLTHHNYIKTFLIFRNDNTYLADVFLTYLRASNRQKKVSTVDKCLACFPAVTKNDTCFSARLLMECHTQFSVCYLK